MPEQNELLDFLATKAQPTPAVQQALATGTISDRNIDPQAMANQALLNKMQPKTEVVIPKETSTATEVTHVQEIQEPSSVKESAAGAESATADGGKVDSEVQSSTNKVVSEGAGQETASLDDLESDLTDKELNFKQLRIAKKELSKTLKEKETELEAIRAKVTKYESGEELPEAIKPLQQRVQELEKYEKLHSLKTSPAYKEAFIKPIEEINSKITAIAADYGIPKNVMEQAVSIKNRAELNRFLSDHFDDVGALEVKQLITRAQEIKTSAQRAEEEPVRVLQEIELQYKNMQEQRRAHNNSVLAATSKDAWTEAHSEIQKEGKALELIFDPANQEHNKQFVEPIVTKAATEYAKIVKLLAQNGLETMPKDLAKAISKMVLLAHSSAVAMETRAAAEREAAELRQNTTRRTNYLRPNTIGSGAPNNSRGEQKPPANPQEAASRVLESVGIRG